MAKSARDSRHSDERRGRQVATGTVNADNSVAYGEYLTAARCLESMTSDLRFHDLLVRSCLMIEPKCAGTEVCKLPTCKICKCLMPEVDCFLPAPIHVACRLPTYSSLMPQLGCAITLHPIL